VESSSLGVGTNVMVDVQQVRTLLVAAGSSLNRLEKSEKWPVEKPSRFF
jgi:hypothetical protein